MSCHEMSCKVMFVSLYVSMYLCIYIGAYTHTCTCIYIYIHDRLRKFVRHHFIWPFLAALEPGSRQMHRAGDHRTMVVPTITALNPETWEETAGASSTACCLALIFLWTFFLVLLRGTRTRLWQKNRWGKVPDVSGYGTVFTEVPS